MAALTETLKGRPIDRIVHLGAQAGVRYSIENPHAYVQSNLVGHVNMLEFARHSDRCAHMVYASSSSVYGSNKQMPFSVEDQFGRASCRARVCQYVEIWEVAGSVKK